MDFHAIDVPRGVTLRRPDHHRAAFKFRLIALDPHTLDPPQRLSDRAVALFLDLLLTQIGAQLALAASLEIDIARHERLGPGLDLDGRQVKAIEFERKDSGDGTGVAHGNLEGCAVKTDGPDRHLRAATSQAGPHKLAQGIGPQAL